MWQQQYDGIKTSQLENALTDTWAAQSCRSAAVGWKLHLNFSI